MLSDRAARHAAALRAPIGIRALHHIGRADLGDGRRADAEAVSRLVLGAIDDLGRQEVATRTRWGTLEENVQLAYAVATGEHR